MPAGAPLSLSGIAHYGNESKLHKNRLSSDNSLHVQKIALFSGGAFRRIATVEPCVAVRKVELAEKLNLSFSAGGSTARLIRIHVNLFSKRRTGMAKLF